MRTRYVSRFVAWLTIALVGVCMPCALAATYKCKDANGNWSDAACGTAAGKGPNASAPESHAKKPPPEWDPTWTGAGPKPRKECQALCMGCSNGHCESLGDIFSMDVSKEKAYEKLVLGCDWRAREQWHKDSSELHFRLSDEYPAEPPGFVMSMDDPHVCL